MRKGDQILQQIIASPGELNELKRVSRIPDEAPVWFVLVHVGAAFLTAKLQGASVRMRVKNGAKTWSVKRDTPETDAVLAPVPPGGAADDFTVADFNSTCLFVMTHGLKPLLRFRLQRLYKIRRASVWRTIGWSEIPIPKQSFATGPFAQDNVLTLVNSKLAASNGMLHNGAEAIGSVAVTVETRVMQLGELRNHGLGVGRVVAAPLPGQDNLGYVTGIPVQGALPVAERLDAPATGHIAGSIGSDRLGGSCSATPRAAGRLRACGTRASVLGRRSTLAGTVAEDSSSASDEVCAPAAAASDDASGDGTTDEESSEGSEATLAVVPVQVQELSRGFRWDAP